MYSASAYSATSTPLIVYCDQVTQGGGWMLLLTQTDGNSDFAGSVVPFRQTASEDQPSLTSTYARDWSSSGVGLLPSAARADEFMIVRRSSGANAVARKCHT